MSKTRVLFSLTLASVAGCSDLPPIDAGQCGNGVVEPARGEECDGRAEGGAVCRPADSAVGACRFDCSASACPAGFGCGIDNICRAASARFENVTRGITAVSSVRLADMDGDGRSDLITESAEGIELVYANDGFTSLDVERLSLPRGRFVTGKLQSATTAEQSTSQSRAFAPSTLVILDTNLTDASAQQGATGGALNVYRGSPRRTLLPTLYPSIPVNADSVKLAAGRMSQRIGQLGVGSDALVFTDVSPYAASRGQRGQGFGLGHFAPAEDGSSANTPLAALPELDPYVASKTVAQYMGIPVSGALVSGYQPAGFPVSLPYPCDTVAWSELTREGDAGSVWLLPLCHLDTSVFDPANAAKTVSYLPNYLPSGADVGPVRRAKLVPPAGAVITGNVTLRDVRRYVPPQDDAPARWEDPDGLLDVLVPSADGLLVAYGDGRWTISDPAPTSLADSTREWRLEAYPGVRGALPPLAFGDFNGDGELDWVDAAAIHFNATSRPLLANLSKALGRRASVARVLDVDQDGVDDLAVGGAGGFDVYRGVKAATMYPNLNKLEYPIDGTVMQIASGDYDGDGHADLSYISRAGVQPSSIDSAGVAYGTAGFPLAPVSLGSMAQLDQLLTLRFSWLLSGTPDAIDSILAYGRTSTGVAAGITLQGKANRQMNARFGLSTLDAPLRRGIALGATSGAFAGGNQEGLMLLGSSVEVTRDQAPTGDVTFRLWYAPSSGDAQLDVATVQSTAPLATVPGVNGQVNAEALRAAAPQYLLGGLGAGDLDGDGVDEAIVALPATATQPARLLVANGAAAQASSSSLSFVEAQLGTDSALSVLPDAPLAVRVGDFDGDGHRDVVVTTRRGAEVIASVFFGDGSKQLTQTRALVVPALGLIDLAPMRGERGHDALVALTATSIRNLVVDRAAGTARFEGDEYVHNARGVHGLATGDVDGDGVADLAISSDSGFVLARGIAVIP